MTQLDQYLGGTQNSSVNEQANFAYYANGSLDTVNRYANAGGTQVSQSTYVYDNDGSLTSLSHGWAYLGSTFLGPGYTYQYLCSCQPGGTDFLRPSGECLSKGSGLFSFSHKSMAA